MNYSHDFLSLILNSMPAFYNWSLLTLHHCVSFCCPTMRISYMKTYIPSLLELPATDPFPTLKVITDHEVPAPSGFITGVFSLS